MTLKTSLTDRFGEFRETYRWTAKKSLGLTALYSLLLFIAFPMIVMIAMENARHNPNISTLEEWIHVYSGSVAALSIAASVLNMIFVTVVSVQQFSYLHGKRSIDLFHALPLTRVPMLLARYCTALTVIAVPVLLNFAVVSGIGFSYGIPPQYALAAIATRMLFFLLVSAAMLSFCVFLAVCTGTTFDMVISLLGINISYPLLIVVLNGFVSHLLPGFNADLKPDSPLLSAFSPYLAAVMPKLYYGKSSQSFSGFSPIWWMLFTVVLLVGAILLYKRRKSECAESNFAFPIPKIIIRFMITAVSGIGFGLVLLSSTSVPSNFYIGVVSGSLAAHIVVEAIYSRGFKQIKRSFVYYGMFVLAFLLFYGVLATGGFGYDTRFPSADQVESIEITLPNQYQYTAENTIYDSETNLQLAKISPVLKDKANIEKTLNLHHSLVAEIRNTSFPYSLMSVDNSVISLTYHLKNGGIAERSYYDYSHTNRKENTPEHQKLLDEMAQRISDMAEFKKTSNLLFYLEPQYFQSASILDDNQKERPEISLTPEAKRELLEAMRQDCLDGNIDAPLRNEGSDGFVLVLDYEGPIQLVDGPLKSLLGGHNGKVHINGRNGFNIKKTAAKTNAVLQKYQWLQ